MSSQEKIVPASPARATGNLSLSPIPDRRWGHLDEIDIFKSRINLEDPIIFLCGGLVDVEESSYLSIRDALLEHSATHEPELIDSFHRAESFTDWLHDSMYSDLLTFEDDIAQIATLVVIVLESAGAIAELGLFCINQKLKHKLLVFVSEFHYEEKSFIKLGPLRYLEKENEGCVYTYPWSQEDIDNTSREHVGDIADDIKCSLSAGRKSEKFDENNNGHVAFLMYELLVVFKSLKLKELEECIFLLAVDVKRDVIVRLLYLMGKLGFISSKNRGNNTFYIPCSKGVRVTFSSAHGKNFDKRKATMSAMQFYATNSSQKHRLSIIKAELRKNSTGDGS